MGYSITARRLVFFKGDLLFFSTTCHLCLLEGGEHKWASVVIHCGMRSQTIPLDINCQFSQFPHFSCEQNHQQQNKIFSFLSSFLLPPSLKLLIWKDFLIRTQPGGGASHIVSVFCQRILECVLARPQRCQTFIFYCFFAMPKVCVSKT